MREELRQSHLIRPDINITDTYNCVW